MVESIKKIDNKIPIVPNVNESLNVLSMTSFTFEQTNVDEIVEITKLLTKIVNKSDPCNSLVWYEAIEYCGYFVTDIVNQSLKSGVFPSEWKTSTVTPIPKIKNRKQASEFRPINTMPNDEKIIEHIVKKQLAKYIEENNLISPLQSASRSKHSCETTLNLIINDWKIAIEGDEIVTVVFLDLKRAFETIDRSIMIRKLEKIGIKGIELKWFCSYLKNRKQQTKFKGHVSKELNVDIGLPQGTALSVILFLFYMDAGP